MPERQYRTLTKRIVDRLAVNGKDAVFWDSDLPGFGLRVYPSGRKVYVVQARNNGKSTRATVGRHGDISPDEVRRDAAKLLARIKARQPIVEPEPQLAPTVADLAERYEREYVALASLPRVSGNRWVFPGRKKSTHQVNINDSWDRVRKHAGLDGEGRREHRRGHSGVGRWQGSTARRFPGGPWRRCRSETARQSTGTGSFKASA